ncbi:SigB/SigF/SigG family RNA polymerase sigma factor [Blautia sp. XA-2221]|uniref:SigB/SigF/SigG family RNA polymerase sigma factor n=1 Tax=Blautia sp. XA-2221 TaxID=2903961 RepID=UPI0023790A67|nr:SigB/SigF/SigG family RNA polymerase sigma factor [Blautia sp. XA-2221]
MEHTLALIGLAHQGDKEARDTIFEENTGLIYSVAKRFLGRGVEMEDLFQIGSIGLLKAVDKFDTGFDVKFSTYAVPMIAGEIRRFLRDDGMLKVSRSIKENCSKVFQTRAELERTLGREPDMEELARAVNMAPEELAMTMEAGAPVESIYKTVYQGEGKEITLADRLEEKENRQENLLNRILLEEVLGKLEKDERRLICMRYFQDMTQTEIAGILGISQVQVSRMEKRIIKQLREFYNGS